MGNLANRILTLETLFDYLSTLKRWVGTAGIFEIPAVPTVNDNSLSKFAAEASFRLLIMDYQ